MCTVHNCSVHNKLSVHTLGLISSQFYMSMYVCTIVQYTYIPTYINISTIVYITINIQYCKRIGLFLVCCLEFCIEIVQHDNTIQYNGYRPCVRIVYTILSLRKGIWFLAGYIIYIPMRRPIQYIVGIHLQLNTEWQQG